MNTNSLLINAQPRYYEVVKDLISQLDAAPPSGDQGDVGGGRFGIDRRVWCRARTAGFHLFDRSVIDDILTITETVTNGNVQTTDQVIISQQGSPGFAFNNQPLGNKLPSIHHELALRVYQLFSGTNQQ